jgi:hypothetical protein
MGLVQNAALNKFGNNIFVLPATPADQKWGVNARMTASKAT